MSIDIRETTNPNHRKKSDVLDEMLIRIDKIEGKLDKLAFENNKEIKDTISYVKSSVSNVENMFYAEAEKRMKSLLLKVFQISGAILLCAPAIVIMFYWLLVLVELL